MLVYQRVSSRNQTSFSSLTFPDTKLHFSSGSAQAMCDDIQLLRELSSKGYPLLNIVIILVLHGFTVIMCCSKLFFFVLKF